MNWQQKESSQNGSFIYVTVLVLLLLLWHARQSSLSYLKSFKSTIKRGIIQEVYHNIHASQINLPSTSLWCMAYFLEVVGLLSFFKTWVFTRWAHNISIIFLFSRTLFNYCISYPSQGAIFCCSIWPTLLAHKCLQWAGSLVV